MWVLSYSIYFETLFVVAYLAAKKFNENERHGFDKDMLHVLLPSDSDIRVQKASDYTIIALFKELNGKWRTHETRRSWKNGRVLCRFHKLRNNYRCH